MTQRTPPDLEARIAAHIRRVGFTQTLAQLASQFGTTPAVIHRIRSRLALTRSGNTDIPGFAVPPPLAPTDDLTVASSNPRAFIDRVMSGRTTLSTDQQRAALAEIILHSPNEANRVAAQNALTRLDAQAGHTISLGPGPPLTDQAKIDRLALLIAACGLPLTRQAIKQAFPRAAALHKALANGFARVDDSEGDEDLEPIEEEPEIPQ